MNANEMSSRIHEAAAYLKDQLGMAEIGIVLGSGLGSFVEALENASYVDYTDIPHFPVSTAPGHAGRWWVGTLRGKRVMMLQGRIHAYEGRALFDVTMYVRVMKLLGVKTLMLTNAAGCVNTAWQAGDLMVLSDCINYSGINPLIGENLDEFGPRFPDMSAAYDRQLIEVAHSIAATIPLTLREGVYMWFSGPSYETPAEIRMARILGADAVGMSTVPETIVARHCGIRVLGISCMTNMAAGILPQPLSHAEVEAAAGKVQTGFRALLSGVVEAI